MKVEILKSSSKNYWYAKCDENIIGQIREVKFSRSRNYKFYKNPIRWIKSITQIEDKELSSRAFGRRYNWKDVKIISLFN